VALLTSSLRSISVRQLVTGSYGVRYYAGAYITIAVSLLELIAYLCGLCARRTSRAPVVAMWTPQPPLSSLRSMYGMEMARPAESQPMSVVVIAAQDGGGGGGGGDVYNGYGYHALPPYGSTNPFHNRNAVF
jgi:hypothetical protein